jgi:hypothetical protein
MPHEAKCRRCKHGLGGDVVAAIIPLPTITKTYGDDDDYNIDWDKMRDWVLCPSCMETLNDFMLEFEEGP